VPAGFILPKTDQLSGYAVRKIPMRTALILLLSCSLLRADTQSELKSALARLTGREPVKASVELQVSSGDGDANKPAGPDSRATAVVEEGPEGLKILWSRAAMDRADEEQRAQARNPEAKAPTRRAMDGLSATTLNGYLDAAPELLRTLDEAVFVEEKTETWEDQPARLLTFKLTPRMDERTRKMIKELDATVKIWIGADGVPLAVERRMFLKGRAFLVISFDSTESESFRLKHTGDRLVVMWHVKESSGTGAGQRNHQKTIATLTLAEG
jgi:hypothetical protein